MKTNSSIMSPAQMRNVWHNGNWQRSRDILGLEIDKRGRCKADEIRTKSPFTYKNNASVYLNCTKNIFKDLSSGKGSPKGIRTFWQELLTQQGFTLNYYEGAEGMVTDGISTLATQKSDTIMHYTTTGSKIKDKKGLSVNYNGTRSRKVAFRPCLRYYLVLERRGISEGTCHYLDCGYLSIRNVKTNQPPLNGRLVVQAQGLSKKRNGLKSIIFAHGGGALTTKQDELYSKYWIFMFQKGLGIYNQDNLLCDRNTQEQIKKSGLIVVEGLFDGASFIEAGCFNGGALMGMQISMMQIARLKFINAHVKIIKVFFNRNVPGGGGVQKALSLPENNGVQVDIFNWHQIVCHSHASPVKLPEQMKDAGDMSAKQLQWLREN